MVAYFWTVCHGNLCNLLQYHTITHVYSLHIAIYLYILYFLSVTLLLLWAAYPENLIMCVRSSTWSHLLRMCSVCVWDRESEKLCSIWDCLYLICILSMCNILKALSYARFHFSEERVVLGSADAVSWSLAVLTDIASSGSLVEHIFSMSCDVLRCSF